MIKCLSVGLIIILIIIFIIMLGFCSIVNMFLFTSIFP